MNRKQLEKRLAYWARLSAALEARGNATGARIAKDTEKRLRREYRAKGGKG